MNIMHSVGSIVARGRAAWAVSTWMAAAMAPALVTAPLHASDSPASHLTISVVRHADTWGNSPYYLKAQLWLADENAQQVLATIVGAEPWQITGTSFSRESAHEWFTDIGASTLEQLVEFTSGTWSIETFTGPDSTMSEFTLDLSKLTVEDLPPTPVVTSPQAFAVDVPRSVQFLWSNPWPSGGPDRLEIYDSSNNGCGPQIEQSLSSLTGGISANALSWQPPAPLGPGFNLFRITSVRYASSTQVSISPVQVLAGSIRWGDAPGAPIGYPSTSPLILIGSHRMITFEVEALRPGDFNGDGVVDGDDLGTLLGNWG